MTRRLGDQVRDGRLVLLGRLPAYFWLPMYEAGDWIVYFAAAAELTGAEAKLTMGRGKTTKASRWRLHRGCRDGSAPPDACKVPPRAGR